MSPIPRWLLFALSALLLTACDRLTGVSPETHLKHAKDFQQQGDLKSAIIELKAALQQAPDNPEGRWLLGQVYLSMGMGNEAEKELARAGQLGRDKHAIKLARGQALILAGRYTPVLNEIKIEADTPPADQPKITHLRGDALFGIGKINDACASYDEARRLDARYIPTYWGASKCALVKGDMPGAISQLNAALAIEPNNPHSHVLLGDLYRTAQDVARAEATYNTAIKLAPNNPDALLGRALVEIQGQRFELARADLAAAKKLAPANLTLRYSEAWLAFREGKTSESRELLQHLLKRAPGHGPALLLAGSVAYSLGAYQQAEESLLRFLTFFPDNGYALQLLATVQLKLGQGPQALKTLQPLLKTGRTTVGVYALIGEAYALNGDFAHAVAYYEKAQSGAPEDAVIRTDLASSRLALGDTARAIAELESATHLDAQQPRADQMLVSAYLSQRQWQKALDAITALEKKLPNDPSNYNLRGAALLGLDDIPNARKNFEQALIINPTYFQAAMNLAQLDLREKNVTAARAHFERILVKDPKNLSALLALAKLAMDANSPQDTVRWLDKAVEANPAILEPRRILTQYHLSHNAPQKALVVAREARTTHPDNPEAIALLGDTQLAVGEKNNALASFGRLIELQPESPAAHLQLAQAQRAVGRLVEAEASFRTSLQRQPEHPQANAGLIDVLIRQKKFNDAQTVVQQLKQHTPHLALAHALEGDLHVATGHPAQAAAAYEAAFRIEEHAQLAIKISQTQHAAGNRRAAYAPLLTWLSHHPQDTGIRLFLATAYRDDHQPRAAAEQYQTLLTQDANNVIALNELALAQLELGAPDAVRYAERAYALKPKAAAVMDTLGWVLLNQGQLARGAELIKNATRLAPEDREIRYHYAVVLAKTGDKPQAQRELTRVLEDPSPFRGREDAQQLLKTP